MIWKRKIRNSRPRQQGWSLKNGWTDEHGMTPGQGRTSVLLSAEGYFAKWGRVALVAGILLSTVSVYTMPTDGGLRIDRYEHRVEVSTGKTKYDKRLATSVALTTTGTNSYSVPGDWNSATNSCECVAGGGNGGNATNTVAGIARGGGGGGGGYSRTNNVSLTPLGTATYNVGAAAGDTWFKGATLAASACGANNGANGASATDSAGAGGAGGSTSGAIGTALLRSGGAGATGAAAGGGGGGAGGPSGNGAGGTASGGAGGGGAFQDGVARAGAGGASGGAGNPGVAGAQFGGGGGGAGKNSTGTNAGGAGAQGIIVLNYTPVPAPTVTSISPAAGSIAGGTAVTVTGTGFTGATGCNVGGVALTGFSVSNSTTIVGTTGAHAAGVVSVVVLAPQGNGTGANLYTYGGSRNYGFIYG